MSSPSFVVCVDESGDQGFNFEAVDCSRWFVLSAVVGLQTQSDGMHDLVRRIKAQIGWTPAKPLHFKRIKSFRREGVIRSLVDGRNLFRAITVLIHKPSLSNPETFTEGNRLYFYYTRYLLERVSWLCAASKEAREKRNGDGTARIIFSSMNEISKVRLKEYMNRLQELDTTINWKVLRPDQIETLSPGKHAGLQLADIIAGGFYCADHHCQKHKTDCWAQMLRPAMFRSSRGKYRGYGVKLCPPEIENAQSALAPWASHFYPE